MKLFFSCQDKPIFTSLSPNVEEDDLELVKKLIFQPKIWRDEKPVRELEKKMRDFLGVKYTFAFNSGRSAFLAILNSLSFKTNDEVLLQAFTCNAVVNPIFWSHLKPIFVDCNEKTLNLDIEDLKRKITPKSKAVMVQHTFGLPADLEEILEICHNPRGSYPNLILIEDCAHSLGAIYKSKKVGTFGKASFFSFGRDKVISSVFGGLAVTNDDQLAKKIKEYQEKIDDPSPFWIFQQLFHPILIFYLIMPFYSLGFGKLPLNFFQKIKILSKAVDNLEKKGKRPDYLPKKMPGVLAQLALHQLKKLEKFNQHRKKIADFYFQNLENLKSLHLPPKEKNHLYLRYPLLIDYLEVSQILRKAIEEKIFLDDGWRDVPVCPPDTDQKAMQYPWQSCPRAEKIAKKILNLPTHINISLKEAQKIVSFLKNYFHSKK